MELQKNVNITFQVNKNLKEAAENLFKQMGMSLNVAINSFLYKKVDEATKASAASQSEGFLDGYSMDEITKAFVETVKKDIKEKQQKGLPVAKYDLQRKQAYLEAPGGSREYVN